jgi:hypothetical protein
MTTEEMQTQLAAYVDLYDTVKQRVKDDAVATAILQELARDARGNAIRAERAERQAGRDTGHGDAATRKQLDWLRDLGVQIPQNLTKAQASSLLDEVLAQNAAR